MFDALGLDLPVFITRNARAKRVWLKMRVGRGLEVVLPFGISQKKVPAILKKHASWIDSQQKAQYQRGEAPGQVTLPQVISLAFLGCSYGVQVKSASQSSWSFDDHQVQFCLPPQGQLEGLGLLQDFLKHLGRKHLKPYAQTLALEIGATPKRIQIRNQRTRWGSCSPLKTISLNAKLLFLPVPLVRHVILHELCHLTHADHSSRFWHALQALDPKTQEHDQALKACAQGIPLWARL